MTSNFFDAEGSTPLDADDLKGLLPKHVTTQGQLNEWEQANILEAEKWVFKRKHKDIVSIPFIQKLHKKMFSLTWTWAGQFRMKQTNIGLPWHQIQSQLKLLCDDVVYQIQHRTFEPDEIAVRFHHRLVFIHPFPNGNGRHARLMADLLITQMQGPRFTWGLKARRSDSISTTGELRKSYLLALREADQGDYRPLMLFARS